MSDFDKYDYELHFVVKAKGMVALRKHQTPEHYFDELRMEIEDKTGLSATIVTQIHAKREPE